MIYFKRIAYITVVLLVMKKIIGCGQTKSLARPFVYPGGGSTSSYIANLYSIANCHKYYVFST